MSITFSATIQNCQQYYYKWKWQ